MWFFIPVIYNCDDENEISQHCNNTETNMNGPPPCFLKHQFLVILREFLCNHHLIVRHFLLSLLHSSNATFVIFCQPQMEIWKSEAWELIKTANNYVKRSAVQSSFRFTPIVSLLLRDVLIFLNYQKCNFWKALCMSLCLWTLHNSEESDMNYFLTSFFFMLLQKNIKWHIR